MSARYGFAGLVKLLSTSCLMAYFVACTETPQTLDSKNDQPAYQGVQSGHEAFVRPGWTAGDKTSWESALRARGQYGANDHARSP